MKNLKISLSITFFSFFLTIIFPLSSIKAQYKYSEKTEIDFSTKTYTKVLDAAKASHKKVFVDAYAVWCAPCKELQKTTFKDAKAAAYYNKNFINISINVEKGEGIELAKKWQIQGLPALLILNENGKIIANHIGYMDGNGLLEFAKEEGSGK